MCEGKKRVLKILRRTVDIVLAAVLLTIVSLTVYIMCRNGSGGTAEIFGVSVVKIVSGSMEPSIRDGDYIIIRKTDTAALKEGDIICFYSEDSDIKGRLNTHRIVGINEDGSFATKGDAVKYPDETAVCPDRIVGRYEGKIGFLRWINSFASAEKLIFIAAVLILTGVSVFEVRTIAKVTKEQRKSKEAEEQQRLIREAIDREKQKLYERQENSGEEQTAPKETEEKEDKEEQEAAEN